MVDLTKDLEGYYGTVAYHVMPIDKQYAFTDGVYALKELIGNNIFIQVFNCLKSYWNFQHPAIYPTLEVINGEYHLLFKDDETGEVVRDQYIAKAPKDTTGKVTFECMHFVWGLISEH